MVLRFVGRGVSGKFLVRPERPFGVPYSKGDLTGLRGLEASWRPWRAPENGPQAPGGDERPLGGLRGPARKEVAVRLRVWGTSFSGRPDRLLASGLPGPPRSPQLLVGLGALSPAGGL